MIRRISEASRGNDQHAFALDEAISESVRVAGDELRIGGAPAASRDTTKQIRRPLEKCIERCRVLGDDVAASLEHELSRSQRDEAEDLAGSAAADRRVILETRDALQQHAVTRRNPAQA